jgi:carbon-monoxide dehydrogenase medium subunit
LNSNLALEALDNIQISHDNLTSDIHASAAYRANLIKEMAKKALQELI